MNATATADVTNRVGYLGGTDAAAIANAHPYKDDLDVYVETLGIRQQSDEETERMLWGKLHEDTIADRYTAVTGRKVRRIAVSSHREHKFLVAHPDRRITGENEGLEIKCTAPRYAADWAEWGEEGSDQVPLRHLFQCTHYMAVMDWRAMDIAVLFNGHEFRLYRIERDDELVDALVAKEVGWWRAHILPQSPPTPTTGDQVSLIYPDSDGVLQPTPASLLPFLIRLEKFARQKSEATKEIENLRDFLLPLLGQGEGFADDNGTALVTCKGRMRRGYDVKKLARDYPDVAAECATLIQYRELRRKPALATLLDVEEGNDTDG